MSKTVRDFPALQGHGLSQGLAADQAEAIAARFAIALSPEIVALAKDGGKGAVHKQFVPDPQELVLAPDELADPIGDETHSPVPGIVHRYPDRVLLNALYTCAVYCRYCFRRETVSHRKPLTSAELDRAFAYIESHPAIWEVILSGGDPLLLSPRRLRAIRDRLERIDHVEIVRIHTRIPLVAPERVTDALLDSLGGTKPCYVVLHCNHEDELTDAVRAAIVRLADRGFPLLSQSVLLAGVNDDVETLERLFRALVRNRVRPYYLHHPDKARGTAHFRVPVARGQALMRALRRAGVRALPADLRAGYPRRTRQGAALTPGYLEREGQESSVCDPRGMRHAYSD